jgi:hypothetical protein
VLITLKSIIITCSSALCNRLATAFLTSCSDPSRTSSPTPGSSFYPETVTAIPRTATLTGEPVELVVTRDAHLGMRCNWQRSPCSRRSCRRDYIHISMKKRNLAPHTGVTNRSTRVAGSVMKFHLGILCNALSCESLSVCAVNSRTVRRWDSLGTNLPHVGPARRGPLLPRKRVFLSPLVYSPQLCQPWSLR